MKSSPGNATRTTPGGVNPRRVPWCRTLAMLVPLLMVSLVRTDQPVPIRETGDPCTLCDGDDSPEIRRLVHSAAESLGARYAAHNLNAIREAGLASGVGEGAASGDGSAEKACLLFQLHALDGIRLVVDLAASPNDYLCIGDDDALAPLRDDYANVAVYPLRFIQRGRIGRGMFCLQYDIPAQYEERIRLGTTTLRTAGESVKLPGRGRTPMLMREYTVAEDEKIALLFESRVCGRAMTMSIEDRGDSLTLVAVHDLKGVYIRKAGVHALGALVLWRNLAVGNELPENPRIGACAYFPKLTFSLPLLLPDLGLDDLREFGYPQPLAPKSWFFYPQRFLPWWVKATSSGVFARWRSLGPRPAILAELFPDL